MAISSSRPASGVSWRCPARRLPPLARTIRNSVTGSGTFLSNHLTSIFGGIEPIIDNYDFRAFTGIQNCGRAAIPDRLAGCLSSAHDDSDFSFQSVSQKIPPT
jgi:hypothetical protein